jgi:hypothetical protein
MSGVIGFSDRSEEIWLKAGWVFRQVLDDVVSQYPEDSAMADKFVEAKAVSGLHIDRLETEFATKVTNAIWQVATGILSGTIRSGIHDQPYGDSRTIEQYRKSLQELLETFPTTWTWRKKHDPERSPSTE